MKYRYTYRVVCYIDVEADSEEEAIEKAEEQFPVEPYVITLDEEPERITWDDVYADAYNDDRRIGL